MRERGCLAGGVVQRKSEGGDGEEGVIDMSTPHGDRGAEGVFAWLSGCQYCGRRVRRHCVALFGCPDDHDGVGVLLPGAGGMS